MRDRCGQVTVKHPDRLTREEQEACIKTVWLFLDDADLFIPLGVDKEWLAAFEAIKRLRMHLMSLPPPVKPEPPMDYGWADS